MFDDMRAWAAGIGIMVALPFVWAYLRKHVPKKVASFFGSRLLAGLRGEGIDDEDIKLYIRQITYATVVLAEAKFPDKGLGKKKFKLVFDLLSNSFPFLESFLSKQGSELGKVINLTVMEMDREFKLLKTAHGKENIVMHLPATPEQRMRGEEPETKE